MFSLKTFAEIRTNMVLKLDKNRTSSYKSQSGLLVIKFECHLTLIINYPQELEQNAMWVQSRINGVVDTNPKDVVVADSLNDSMTF